MMLSFRTKESIKTALALTIAYGIALSQDWNSPLWAGFAVIFVSLSTSGQSFNKSALRMVGAFAAGAASLTLIALFPQDRWGFMLGLSVYIGFCTYMMNTDKYQYFWFSAGYVCIIIVLESGPNPVHAFDLAILRIQETTLGILVYSIITALLWRSNSVDKFHTLTQQLHQSQRQLYQAYFALMQGRGDSLEAKKLLSQVMQQQAQFEVLRAAAETDSYKVDEIKHLWRLYQSQLYDLHILLERWHDNFYIIHTLDIAKIIPELDEFNQEIEQRLTQLEALLNGQSPARPAQAIQLHIDENSANQLSAFQQAAVLLTHTHLGELEQLTHALYQNLADIKGFAEQPNTIQHPQTPSAKPSLDIERCAGVLQVMASLWLAYLIFIYVDAVPGGIVLVIFSGVLGMVLSANPAMLVASMVTPFMLSLVMAGLVYTFWMPHLTSFIGLGSLLFITTFIICYLYSTPQQGLGRAAGLSMIVTILGIENQQTYNILAVYNWILAFSIIFVILFIVAYVPFPPRPERAFLRLLKRFFQRSEFLMTSQFSGQQPTRSFWARKRLDFYLQDLRTLPNKIEQRSRLINIEQVGVSSEQLQSMNAAIQMLSLRLQFLLEARANPQSQLLLDELLADGHVWRARLQEVFQSLADYPALSNHAKWQQQMTETMALFELRITRLLNQTNDVPLSREDKENFYYLLGAYQGVSDATLEYSSYARLINWEQWNEARF
ncbi:MAG: hypothetical protein GQ475_05265 [Methylococcaceae bacterium]|nr:hypothetical protein [Methylococcaceae bacterium]